MSGDFTPEALGRMLQERLGDLVGGVDPGGKASEASHTVASADDFQATFKTPAGERVLMQLVSMTILSPRWDFSQPTGYGFYREGQCSMTQYIIDQMHTASAKDGEAET